MWGRAPPSHIPQTEFETVSDNAKKPRKKHLLGAAAALLVLVLLGVALRPQPLPADFAEVLTGPLRVTVDEEGETRVRDRYVVSAPVAGKVLRIRLEPGDPVVADETVLATFQPVDPTPLDDRSRSEAEARVKAAEAAVGRAEAQGESSRAELRFAEVEIERYERLAREQIISRQHLESTELELNTRREAVRAAEFQAASAEQELAAARASLLEVSSGEVSAGGSPIEIRSPVEGLVLRRLRESEAVVPVGEPLLEVADPTDLEIVSDLLSTDAVKVRPGAAVLIERWGGADELRGRVRRIEPSGFTKVSALGVEEQRVNVIVDFEDPREAWEALGDAYRVEVAIVVWERDSVIKVPTSSLFRDGDGWAVYAVEEGTAVRRTVELGQRNGLEAEILAGLSEGERVIVHPSDKIEDGVAVAERSA